MSGCEPTEVVNLLQGIIESSLAYCGYFKSPGRLEQLATELSLLAGLDPDHAAAVGQATALCDLGMLGMPPELLGRDGALRPHEREIMQTHTTVGHELLSSIQHPTFQLAATVAAAHHERMDGGGYPAGLEAPAIPIEVRIAAVVTIYVALTQPRPFRTMRTHAEAIELLRGLAGSHLDADLVTLLIDHQDRFRFQA
jgi:HD-GYP domain-containing protein (c-di-GMP phosphodiesterase class II)